MTRTLTRRRVVAALAGLPLVGLSLAHRAAADHKPGHNPPTPTPTAEQTFFIRIGSQEFNSVDELVRGGAVGPQFTMMLWGCTKPGDWITVDSQNGFSGTGTLEILNLPAEVTSQTVTSFFLPAFEDQFIDLELVAASNAELGMATVTIRVTIGEIVRTVELDIWVVDELTPCP